MGLQGRSAELGPHTVLAPFGSLCNLGKSVCLLEPCSSPVQWAGRGTCSRPETFSKLIVSLVVMVTVSVPRDVLQSNTLCFLGTTMGFEPSSSLQPAAGGEGLEWLSRGSHAPSAPLHVCQPMAHALPGPGSAGSFRLEPSSAFTGGQGQCGPLSKPPVQPLFIGANSTSSLVLCEFDLDNVWASCWLRWEGICLQCGSPDSS